MTFEEMRRCDCTSVLRHTYFSNIVTAAAVVIIKHALKIAKNNNGYANALLYYVLQTLPFFCKILNLFQFNDTFCQLIWLLSSFAT
jgi:hypothetical protein